MKTLSIKVLAAQVATLLGEALGIDSIEADSPFPDIESRVRLIAPGILSKLLLEAPVSQLPASFPITDNLAIDPYGVARLDLPDNFLRLVSLKLSDWQRPLSEISSDPATLAMQASDIDGIKGSPQRPVAIIDIDAFGTKQLKLFSTSSGSRLEHAFYVPVPEVDAADSISCPETMHHALVEGMLKDFSQQ